MVFASLFLLLFVSCKKEGSTRQAIQTDYTPSGKVMETADKTTVQRLAPLGFHVFPEPIALPPFSAQALSGQPFNTQNLPDKVILLNFWATWCPPCKKEMPSIERLNTLMKNEPFMIAAISVGESRDTVSSFIQNNGYTFPIFLDPDNTLGRAFASQGIPTTYVVDRSGMVVAGIVGSRDYDDPELVEIFRELARQ